MKNVYRSAIAVLLILFLAACSPDHKASPSKAPVKSQTAYALDWKIAPGEVVAYSTAMNPAENTSSNFSFNYDSLDPETRAILDPENHVILDKLEQVISELNLPRTYSMISILTPTSRGTISVKMILDKTDQPESQPGQLGEGFDQFWGAMQGTVQLRGEVTPDGAIASFYLEERQRNLLAMFFELPTTPVKVGDSWSIDVNCISMGNGFIVSKAQRENRVLFAELSQTPDGKPIAVLEYFIGEIVDGKFKSPTSGETAPQSMLCTFIGQGQFLIEEGRWKQFTGEMTVIAKGFMESNTTQLFALVPLENVPSEYLNME